MTTYPTTYDAAIKNAIAKYWPMCPDWRYGKAQLIAESNLDPYAKSEAGAIGIAQFIPETWDEAVVEMVLPTRAEPNDVTYAIPAYAWYMDKMWDFWTNPKRLTLDRLRLAQASYNAGAGNLLKAQRLAGMPVEYDRIVRALPRVTSPSNARQTTDYVARIARIYAELIA